MSPQKAFDQASEWLEHTFATWQGALAYFVLCLMSAGLWGWDGLDKFVYLTGAVLLVVLTGSGRRGAKATHAKLDKITPGHEFDRLEERQEREIEEARSQDEDCNQA